MRKHLDNIQNPFPLGSSVFQDNFGSFGMCRPLDSSAFSIWTGKPAAPSKERRNVAPTGATSRDSPELKSSDIKLVLYNEPGGRYGWKCELNDAGWETGSFDCLGDRACLLFGSAGPRPPREEGARRAWISNDTRICIYQNTPRYPRDGYALSRM